MSNTTKVITSVAFSLNYIFHCRSNVGNGGSGRQLNRNRTTRMVRAAAIRGSGSRSTSASSIMATRPVVPATYVPEELVAQAQVVLQGKTRNLIIRELQVSSNQTEHIKCTLT